MFFAATTHDEIQPAHLKVRDPSLCAERCAREFGNPCQRFCPANVYEMVDDGQGGKRLQINAANCVHCKACDIKDPYGVIDWTPPKAVRDRTTNRYNGTMSEVWRPSAARVADSNLTRFTACLNARKGMKLDGY